VNARLAENHRKGADTGIDRIGTRDASAAPAASFITADSESTRRFKRTEFSRGSDLGLWAALGDQGAEWQILRL
jgi:hypothetical protein